MDCFINFPSIDNFGKRINSYSKLTFTINYQAYLRTDRRMEGFYHCYIDKRNSLENTNELIRMTNVDSLSEAKQYLRNILRLVEAAELPGGGRAVNCENCFSWQRPITKKGTSMMGFSINEPGWSDCDGCVIR